MQPTKKKKPQSAHDDNKSPCDLQHSSLTEISTHARIFLLVQFICTVPSLTVALTIRANRRAYSIGFNYLSRTFYLNIQDNLRRFTAIGALGTQPGGARVGYLIR